MTAKSSDLNGVEQKLRELAAQGRVDELIALVIDLLAKVQRDNTALASRLHTALRQLYGRKSEKISAEQLSLLFSELGDRVPPSAKDALGDTTAQPDDDGAIKQPDVRPRPAGHRGGRRSPFPDTLPRRKRFIRVPDELRGCSKCGNDKSPIAPITSEILEFIPAQFIVIEEEREKLICKSCGTGIIAAESTKPMDRGRPGPGLLSAIVVSKSQDSLPLYRQSQIYARGQVQISDSTLGDWFAFAANVLVPLAQRLRALALQAPVLVADDTGLPVQEKNNPKHKTKRGHLWAYVGYRDDGHLVVFDYTPTWEAIGPRQFLEPFTGMLQGDGYAGFKRALTREQGDPLVSDNRRLGCAMHIRRKFEAAYQANDLRAGIALAYFHKLYDVERQCKSEQLSHDQRQACRQEQSLPVLDDLYRWIDEIHPSLVPGDKLHDATRYAINQAVFFRRCFENGRYEIDNGEVEQQLRRVAIGRKNFLFAGSDKAAERLAVVYSLLGTCHMHGVDPLAYLTDVIDKLQNRWPQSRIDELLPHRWCPPGLPYWHALQELPPANSDPAPHASTPAPAPE